MKRFNKWVDDVLLTGFRETEMYEPRITWVPGEAGGSIAAFHVPPWLAKDMTQAVAAQLWRCAGLVNQGVKAHAPSLPEAEALAETEVNIPCLDYRQPFETMVVVMPDGFPAHPISDDVGRPFAILGRHLEVDGRFLFSMGILADGKFTLSCDYYWSPGESRTVEEYCFAHNRLSDNFFQTERDGLADCRRLFINANLLLTQYGAKRLGASDPARESSLLEAVRDGNRAERRAAERDLKTLPVVYGIDQNVKVYETEGFSEGQSAGGWHVKPHWRRGHWAMVACGTGRKDRRRAFRPAVMVNANRFGGAPADTRATYTTGGAV